MTLEDGELADHARKGDQRAFADLVRRYQDRIFRFILRLTGSRDEAMDLTQDTFMKAWQAIPRTHRIETRHRTRTPPGTLDVERYRQCPPI